MRAMIPKEEIGVVEFVQKNADFDGRGVVIAVWDTGVDPTARGLQVTSEGKPKVIDFIDASGSGDVRMLESIKVTDSARSITTLTGRSVSIPVSWKPIDGVIFMGVKSASELFPKDLLGQLRTEATDHVWCRSMQRLSTVLKEVRDPVSVTSGGNAKVTGTVDARVYQKTKNNNEDELSTGSFASCVCENSAITTEPLSTLPVESAFKGFEAANFRSLSEWLTSLSQEKKESSVKEMEQILTSINENNEYFAPVFDCFVFKGEDGDFLACVDTSPYEEMPTTLADMPLMKDFSIDRQVGHFGNDMLLYYTVKILEEGKLLQIVTNSGSHATHVAAIAAAYFPVTETRGSPRPGDAGTSSNGVAPGAQIVSIKIADTHLGAMETNVALLRAINWTIKLNCDIVNYSFGEKAFLPNFGRIYTHLTQFVLQTNVAFVTSGGNDGPSLGTVGAPGGSVECLIGVAPLISPEMMKCMYCQPTFSRQKPIKIVPRLVSLETPSPKPETDALEPVVSAYTWGSRGPAPDGSLGLTVAACGAAVADVAAWKRTAFDLLHGSSMSSPSVAGAVALILSALRQSEVDPNLRVPFNLWRAAISARSKPLPHLSPLDQGAGLFQVGPIFTYLQKLCKVPSSAAFTAESSGPLTPMVRLEPSSKGNTAGALNDNCGVDGGGCLGRFSGWRLHCHVTGPGCILENNKNLNSRGIWLRHGWIPLQKIDQDDSAIPNLKYKVHLRPDFCQDISAEFKRSFSLNLSVRMGYNSSDRGMPPWLSIAPQVLLANQPRVVSLFIDPVAFPNGVQEEEELNPPSAVYHTSIDFVHTDLPEEVVLAQLPITIQLPGLCRFDEATGAYRFGLQGDFSYTRKVCRWFVRIPRGSTAGVFHLWRADQNGGAPCIFTVTIVEPTPVGSVRGAGLEVVHRCVTFNSFAAGGVGLTERPDTPANYDTASGTYAFPFPVAWVSETVEVTVAQHHGADVPATCRMVGHLSFHGLEVQPPKIVFHTFQTYFPVHLRSNFGQESINWELQSKKWVLPVKPTLHRRSYRKLPAFQEDCLGVRGGHVLSLEYRFVCPFKTDNVVFDFTRLTSLLYEADIIQILYHVYDGCDLYKGAGSYQFITNPKYTFKLSKGPHKVVATILYADSKKVSYEAKENDQLDKLKKYPMLVHLTLPTQPAVGGEGGSPQLVLEVTTSPATLGLAEVDYEKSYHLTSSLGSSTSNGGLSVQNEDELSGDSANHIPKKDAFFGSLQKFSNVPGHLSAGEAITEVFGVTEENLADYAIPGSYFVGRIYYYGNRYIRHTVPLDIEVHVGPNVSPLSVAPKSSKPAATVSGRGAFGLQAQDLHHLRWIAGVYFFGKEGETAQSTGWLSPFVLGKEAAKKKSPDIINSKKTSISKVHNAAPKNKKSLHLVQYAKVLISADDGFNPDRGSVWTRVNSAMRDLVEAVGANSTRTDDPVMHLLPGFPHSEEEGTSITDGDCDDDGLGVIPLLKVNDETAKVTSDHHKPETPTNEPEVDTLVNTEKAVSLTASTSQSMNRALVIEVLCIYGRHLCEQMLVNSRRGGRNVGPEKFSSRGLIAIRMIITRLNQMLSKGKLTSGSHLKNFFEGNKADVTMTGLCESELDRVKPQFGLFWLAQLFILESELSLLKALVRLAFQLDTPVKKPGSPVVTLGTRICDPKCEVAALACAGISFPWMIEQLHRMGLRSVATPLARQLPARFPSFDYTLVLPRSHPSLPGDSQRKK